MVFNFKTVAITLYMCYL